MFTHVDPAHTYTLPVSVSKMTCPVNGLSGRSVERHTPVLREPEEVEETAITKSPKLQKSL
jgi:hypothetical protein